MSAISATTMEYHALVKDNFNLTDAHPRYISVKSQEKILNNLHHIFNEARIFSYGKIADDFKNIFYTLAGQNYALTLNSSPMYCYSASLCIQILASYLRKNMFTVALMHPAFDNVVGILRAEKIPLLPLSEDQLPQINKYLTINKVEAIWLTLPNNPTGTYINKKVFKTIVSECKKRKIMLIIDFCFRFFCKSLLEWDQYKMLITSGITYAAIEDTGKSWPTQDLKIGILQSSNNIYNDLYYFYDNHLLNVSPVILLLLTKLLKDVQVKGFEKTIHKVISTNRNLLRQETMGTILNVDQSDALMTVGWLKIQDNNLTAQQLYEICKKSGVNILPGNNFYWATPEVGSHYVRISLARDTVYLKAGLKRIKQVLDSLGRSKNI